MQKVLVTGSTGFIGSRLCTRLEELGINVTRSKVRLDIPPSDEASSLDFSGYDTVFHLAGLVGGIIYNLHNPSTMFMQNMKITINVLEAWARARTAKLIVPGSACAYPDSLGKDMQESYYLSGEPHWSNIEYAYAKRAALVALRGYAEQSHTLKYSYPILANVYGPGSNFESLAKLHVVPALAYKFLDTSQPVEVLGSGKAVRDFLYIDDAVEALIHSAQVDDNWAVNYGTGIGHDVAYIVDKFAGVTGRDDVTYHSDLPDGQMYRVLDVRMANARGWKAKVNFDEGLERTMQWVKTVSK